MASLEKSILDYLSSKDNSEWTSLNRFLKKKFKNPSTENLADISRVLKEMEQQEKISLEDGQNFKLGPIDLAFSDDAKTEWNTFENKIINVKISDKTKKELSDNMLAWYQSKNAKRIFDTYWVTFFIAVAGLTISIVLVILRIAESRGQLHSK